VSNRGGLLVGRGARCEGPAGGVYLPEDISRWMEKAFTSEEFANRVPTRCRGAVKRGRACRGWGAGSAPWQWLLMHFGLDAWVRTPGNGTAATTHLVSGSVVITTTETPAGPREMLIEVAGSAGHGFPA
jgi:hypothetical protein